MDRMICCAVGCGHKSGYGCHFYNFPSPNDGPDWEKWYDIWVLRINKVNADGELWRPDTPNTKLCSCHFRPEDQWDPKSRKGGLKCKEPVFFDNSPASSSPAPSGSQLQQSVSSTSTERISARSTVKRPWYVTSPPNVGCSPSESIKPAARKITLQSLHQGRQKSKAVFRSQRMPPLKIREYLEKQDDTTFHGLDADQTISNLNTSSRAARGQQRRIPTDFTKIQRRILPSSQGSLSSNYRGQGSVIELAEDQLDDENLQMIDPEHIDADVIEVVDSDDNASGIGVDNSPTQEVSVKYEQVDTHHDFAHVTTTTCVQQATPPLSVKIETDSSSLPSDSILDFEGDSMHVPQILSAQSLECDAANQDDSTSNLPQLIEMQHDHTPKENLDVVLPRNTTHTTKISNVKPIRVFTSKSLASDLNIQQEAMSLGSITKEEDTNTHTYVENVYDQMLNKLMAPELRFHQDTMEATVSQENVVNIADMLSDHQTSTENGHMNLKQALNRIKELEQILSMERFGLHRYCGSDEKIKFYTGFRSGDTLMRFFWRIEPDDLTSERSGKWKDALKFAKETLQEHGSSEDFTRKVISYMDELFLFLCHLWLGLSPEDLADRFTLPSTTCAEFIILRWIYYLKATLPSTAESTKSTLPPSKCPGFQGQYSNTRLLLHCMEIKVQQKSILNHLSSTRLKSLVGFSPSGEVVCTSDLMPEGTSDRDLLQNCGVLTLLRSGDGVISEGKLEQSDMFSSVGITYQSLPAVDLPHDPAMLKLGSSTRDPHRCHTEVVRLLSAKYVSSMTGFKCFHSVVLYPFAHCVGDIWEVCCRLINYQQGHRSL